MEASVSLVLVPKAGMVLIKPIETKPASLGVIELADYYQEPETTGQIVALAERFVCEDCGAGRETELRVGMVVIFPPSAGTAIEFPPGERHLMLREADVIAVVEDEVTV